MVQGRILMEAERMGLVTVSLRAFFPSECSVFLTQSKDMWIKSTGYPDWIPWGSHPLRIRKVGVYHQRVDRSVHFQWFVVMG